MMGKPRATTPIALLPSKLATIMLSKMPLRDRATIVRVLGNK